MKNDSEAPMTPCNQYGVLGQRQSSLVTKTVREAPAEEDSINASLLLRAGFIRKHMAGTYSFLPLGMLSTAVKTRGYLADSAGKRH